ncbi:sensor histidine kinase [Marinicrinis lubricantis]|uniref:histidine kinase n=1 Tax=Marinicrinis lubricantis TaxID=2086470 RepID=A0ABW1IM54_9BACL
MNMMLLYSFVLTAAAGVLFFANRKGEVNRWGALFFVCASLGGFAEEFKSAFLLEHQGESGWVAAAIYAVLYISNLVVTPYFALWFGFSYAGKVDLRKRSWWKWVTMLPIVSMVCFTDYSQTEPSVPAAALCVVAIFYYLGSAWMFLYAAISERQSRFFTNRMFTALAVAPTLLAVVLFIYMIPLFQPDFSFFPYVGWFIAYSFALGTSFSVYQGMLGVRIRVEANPLESSVRAAHTGAAFLNHSIKNDIGKIRLAAENLKRLGPLNESQLEQLKLLQRSSNHLLEMSQRILQQLREMEWEEQFVHVKPLMQQVLSQSKMNSKADGIEIHLEMDEQLAVFADPVHFAEVLTNLISNALEAMNHRGTLRIRMKKTRRKLLLLIEDTGPGMTRKELDRIFEPYYSTKSSQSNYGLGLTYCYQVLRKAGIGFEIGSVPQKGTTVTLLFPNKKVVSLQEGPT